MSNVIVSKDKIDILANAISAKSGEPVTMTLDDMVRAVDGIDGGGGGSGTAAISVVDTTDTAGGTIRTITALDISDTTAVASDVASGKYFYTSQGQKTAGTASGGGGGLEYEEGTWTPSADVSKPTINFANSHTNRPFFVMMTDTSEEVQTANYMLGWFIGDWYDAFGCYLRIGATQENYARTQAIYATGSNFSSAAGNISFLTGDSETTQMGYYLTNEAFSPYTGASSRWWKAGHTYKWIAVWPPTT